MALEYRLPNMGGTTMATRLASRLMEELRTGVFAKSGRLPAEVELAEAYGVSRSVIRDVLGELEREGYVARGRGIGTVVNRQIVQLNTRLDIKLEYNELIRGAGFVPSARCLRLYTQPAEEALAQSLAIGTGAPVIICEKLVMASGRPAIYSIDRIPENRMAEANWQQMDWTRPVYELLEEGVGITVDTNIAHLTAEIGPEAVRKTMAATAQEAFLRMEETGYYKLTSPILHSTGYYSNLFHFALVRKQV